MDADATVPKMDTENLPETYVIFITVNDVLCGGKIGDLMHDFSCKKSEDMKNTILAEKV